MATVRSVTVRLNADVAGYIRDMKAAGAATDSAFDKASRGMASSNSTMSSSSKQLQDVDTSAAGASRSVSALGSNVSTLDRNVTTMNRSLRSGGKELDSFSGRARLITEALVIGGPALVALGAVAVPAVTGLAAAFGFAAIGAGTLVAGFQGVGDAFGAVNKAQLEPTAANLEAARVAMEQLSPSARSMVGELDRLSPALVELRDASAQGIAPQMARGVDELLVGLPKLRGFFEETSSAAASVLADGAGILTADRWQPFLQFLEDEAPDAILSLGRSMGDLSFGFAELFRNMGPINNDVLGFIEKASDGFGDWASGLEGSEGLTNFFAYLRETGPQVGEALGAMANAIVEISKAAAPLSGPVLSAITGVSNALAAVASSDAGAPLFAMAAGALALNRALKITAALAAAPAITGLMGGGAAAAGAAGAATTAAATTAGSAAAAGATAGFAATLRTAAVRAGVIGTVSVLVAKSIGGPIASLMPQVDLLDQSTDRLATNLSRGTIPDELRNIGESAEFLAGRSNFDQFFDGFDRFVGSEWGKLKEADVELAAMDDALTLLAQQKGPEAAMRAFQDLGREAGYTSEQMGQIRAQLPNFDAAVGGAKNIGNLLNIFEDVPGAIDRATASANTFKAALQSAAGVLEGRSNMRAFEESIDAASASLRENGKNLDITTAKGRANAAALDGIAASALTVAQKMRGANKVEFMEGARAQFIDMARDMGKTAEGARRLADKLGLIKPVDVKLDLDADGFLSKVERARAALLDLDRKKAKPGADMDITPLTGAQKRAMNDVGDLDRQKPTPTANLNDGPFQGRHRGVMGALNVTDRFTATPTANLQDNASGPARGIAAAINGIPAFKSSTVTVTTIRQTINRVSNVVSGTVRGLFGARGMMVQGGVQAFAGGGMRDPSDRPDNHLPEFAAAGPTRVWREPETRGESYIPWADDHRRPRAKAITEATAELFGGRVEWYAMGDGPRGGNARGMDRGRDRNDLGRASREAGDGLRSLSGRLREAKNAVEAERKQREKLVQAQKQVVTTGRDLFRTELFGASDSAWGSLDPFGQIKQDIAGGREYKLLMSRLKKMGLDGDALAEGAGTLESARYLAGLGKRRVREFEDLYERRDRVSAQAGRAAGNAAYGAEVRETNRELRQANQRLNKIERAVKAADKNNKDGHRDSGKRTAKALDGGANKARRRASGPGGRTL